MLIFVSTSDMERGEGGVSLDDEFEDVFLFMSTSDDAREGDELSLPVVVIAMTEKDGEAIAAC